MVDDDRLGESKDANGYYQSFTYDGFGSLTSVTDSESSNLFSATYAYGIAPFQTASTDMDLGFPRYGLEFQRRETGQCVYRDG
jgi:YD repeat-containing protein